MISLFPPKYYDAESYINYLGSNRYRHWKEAEIILILLIPEDFIGSGNIWMEKILVKVSGGGYSKCGLQTCSISNFWELLINPNSCTHQTSFQIPNQNLLRVDSRNALSKFFWLFVCMLQFEKHCSRSQTCILKYFAEVW